MKGEWSISGIRARRPLSPPPAHRAGRAVLHRGTLRRLGVTAAALCVLLLAGCRNEMHDQPRYKPLRQSAFFGDQQSARPLVEGTVARGELPPGDLLHTGTSGGRLADALPFPATREVLQRGRERYDIFCAPCHGVTGDGRGMIVLRGFRPPPTLHDKRLRTAPLGHFYVVITRGIGVMPSYAARVGVHDRWAIAAYMRALQLSQNATLDDVPAEERKKLSETQPQ